MLAGIASSTTTMVAVSLLTQRLNPVPSHIIATMQSAAQHNAYPKQLTAKSDTSLAIEAIEVEGMLNSNKDNGKQK